MAFRFHGSKKKFPETQRYSEEKKDEIISFVQKHNGENGRGGVARAVRKFGVSPITINSWLSKKGGGPKPRGGKAQDILSQLVTVRDEIAHLEREVAVRRKQFDKLKKQL